MTYHIWHVYFAQSWAGSNRDLGGQQLEQPRLSPERCSDGRVVGAGTRPVGKTEIITEGESPSNTRLF